MVGYGTGTSAGYGGVHVGYGRYLYHVSNRVMVSVYGRVNGKHKW